VCTAHLAPPPTHPHPLNTPNVQCILSHTLFSSANNKNNNNNKTYVSIPKHLLTFVRGKVHDLTTLQQAVGFSRRYTLEEVQERWHALLYDPTVSRLACAAIASLDEGERMGAAATLLWSPEEEVSGLRLSSRGCRTCCRCPCVFVCVVCIVYVCNCKQMLYGVPPKWDEELGSRE